MAETPSQRSALKDFLASIATIRGDLSNITAPPFVLSQQSTTELPAYWAENPSIFTAAAKGETPEARILLVLKWFLLSLKRQQYGGRPESDGVKKPLNAYLGELFLASFGTGETATTLLSEQVSHHPPVTACSLRADGAGVRADGFAAQRITFSGGGVHVLQMGHAIITLLGHDGETYLVPLPEVKVSGLLGGSPYPELSGRYVLPSSSGWRAEVEFKGTKMLGLSGERHQVTAAVYGPDDTTAKWTVEGTWTGKMIVKDAEGKDVDAYDATELQPEPPRLPDTQDQSPWESRRAWKGVSDALGKGDMQGAADSKSVVENAQRAQREKRTEEWKPLFFRKADGDVRWDKLKGMLPEEQQKGSRDMGFWVVDETNKDLKRPFRDGAPYEA